PCRLCLAGPRPRLSRPLLPVCLLPLRRPPRSTLFPYRRSSDLVLDEVEAALQDASTGPGAGGVGGGSGAGGAHGAASCHGARVGTMEAPAELCSMETP